MLIIGLVVLWFMLSYVFLFSLAFVAGVSTNDRHSFSYEAGHMRGVIDAQEDGILPVEDLEANAIASYLMARRSLDVEILDYCRGYVEGAAMHWNGFC